MSVQDKDVVVIGAGPAGYVCAIRLAQMGKKVTVIEKQDLGGVCLNIGCIPSKALIHAATVYEEIQNAGEMGIKVGKPSVDMAQLQKWKSSVVKKLTGGVGALLKANKCEIIEGEAKFTGPQGLIVKTSKGTQEIKFNQCVVATGSRPISIPGADIDQRDILDSTGALSLERPPKSLLCIGGGYIGLELGTYFAKLGTKVHVVEAMDQLLGSMDPDLVNVVKKGLISRGVDVRVKTFFKGAKKAKSGFIVDLESSNGKDSIEVEKVLVTVGRVPNTDQLDLEKAGVRLDQKGFIPVNARRQTQIPTIYAVGDIAGQPLLAHKGSKEGIVAAEAIAGKKTEYDVVAMPAVVFTDPEVATVGMSQAEAVKAGIDVSVGTFPFAANGRALSVRHTEGLVKIIGDNKTGRLLGVHIVGPEASNLIAEAALALEMGAQVEDLALTVHAHPTLPEAVMEAAESNLGHAIHIYQRKRPSPSPHLSANA